MHRCDRRASAQLELFYYPDVETFCALRFLNPFFVMLDSVGKGRKKEKRFTGILKELWLR